MAKDGTKKTILQLSTSEHAAQLFAIPLVAALNAHAEFNEFFKFDTDTFAERVVVHATGRWDLPGNQRPAHGTMKTWAEGYLACLQDADAANARALLSTAGYGSDGQNDGERA